MAAFFAHILYGKSRILEGDRARGHFVFLMAIFCCLDGKKAV